MAAGTLRSKAGVDIDMKPPLGKLTPTSLGDRAYQEIRNGILTNHFAPGDKLVIDMLARELGISLGPVREALARLLSEQMVAFERNKGYRVSAQPSTDDVKMWQDARLVIECGAIGYAAALATKADVAELRTINGEIRRGEFGPGRAPVVDFMELNNRFHRKIFDIAGNPVLLKMYFEMNYGPQVTRQLTRTGVDDKREIVAEHQGIIAAIEKHDAAAAAQAMRAHITRSLERAFLRQEKLT